MEEPNIWATLKQRDTVIFYNNDFEVFIDPDMSTFNYGEIEINAFNTVWDLTLNKPYRVGGSADNSWNLDEIKTAVNIVGTLNNSSDIDSFWTVEMAIPLKPLMKLKNSEENAPVNNEQWRINFSRVNWNFDLTDGKYSRKKENGKYLPEYNWVWSPQGVINMHEPEKWGYLQFSDNSTLNGVEFIEDENIMYKQAAYALFRLTRFGSLKHLMKTEVGHTENFMASLSDTSTTKASFTKTDTGFEYVIQHPNQSKTFVINQDGWLSLK